MRKLTYLIVPNEGNYYHVEFITDREPKWTEEQFCKEKRKGLRKTGKEKAGAG